MQQINHKISEFRNNYYNSSTKSAPAKGNEGGEAQESPRDGFVLGTGDESEGTCMLLHAITARTGG